MKAVLPSETTENLDSNEPSFGEQVQFSGQPDQFIRYDLNENDYIYRHVHKRLDVLANARYVDYPIFSDLQQLQDTYERRLEMNPSEYSKTMAQLQSSISSHVRVLNQQELAAVLTKIKKNNTKPFRDVRQLIDLELRWLLKKNVGTGLMDLDLWFYVADLFYECRMHSTFVQVLVHHFGKEKDISMTNAQFLHLLFLVITRRDERNILSLYEERIVELLDSASIEDISVICMAYFKTKTRIRNPEIVKKIIDRTTLFLDNIKPEEPGYSSIMKALRYSKIVDYEKDVRPIEASKKLISSIITSDKGREIVFKSNYNMIHTLKFMEEFRIYDAVTADSCRRYIFDNIHNSRSKDIQYCVTSLSNMAYNNLNLDLGLKKDFENLVDLIVTKRVHDFTDERFSHHLLAMMRAFAMYGYYDSRLMSRATDLLASSVEVWSQRLVDFNKTALLLYVAPQIEGSDAYLNQHAILKQVSNSIQRIGIRPGKIKREGISRLSELLLGSKVKGVSVNPIMSRMYQKLANDLLEHRSFDDESYNFAFQYTMPQLNYADLIISKGCNEPGSYNPETLMPQKVPSNEKHCLVYATTRFDYFAGDDKKLCGYKLFNVRLLERLGYKVVLADLTNPTSDELASQVDSILND